MRQRWIFLGAILAVAAADGLRALAREGLEDKGVDEPYAPSAGAAPIVSLGYREAAADLLFFRLVGYFGSGKQATPEGVAALAEAISALDPYYQKIYTWGARAMVAVRHEQTPNEISLRAVRLLETGAALYPDDYRIPQLAGEIYLFDLHTKDDAQRRDWNELAARWIETAIRKPNAPASMGTLAAHLRTKLGQKQRAIDNLKELILITDDTKAREELFAKLAELEVGDQDEIAADLLLARKQFEAQWRRDRPEMRASLYLLVGPRPKPGFDMRDLATGGRDLLDLNEITR